MGNSFTIKINDQDTEVNNKVVCAYADHYFGTDNEFRSRISKLFLIDFFIYTTELGANAVRIVEEIHNLEIGYNNTDTKPASLFKKRPLKRLWHKHYFSVPFIAQNIRNTLWGSKLEEIIANKCAKAESHFYFQKLASDIANTAIRDSLKVRTSNKKLTGEWIIFAKEKERNYYLCLSAHNGEDHKLADIINKNCTPEYPFISTILGSSSA